MAGIKRGACPGRTEITAPQWPELLYNFNGYKRYIYSKL